MRLFFVVFNHCVLGKSSTVKKCILFEGGSGRDEKKYLDSQEPQNRRVQSRKSAGDNMSKTERSTSEINAALSQKRETFF